MIHDIFIFYLMADLNWILFYNTYSRSKFDPFFTLFGFDLCNTKHVLDISRPEKFSEDMMANAYLINEIDTKFMTPFSILKYIFQPYFGLSKEFNFHRKEDPDYDSYILFEYFLPPRNHSGIKVFYTTFPQTIKNALEKCGTIEDKKLNQILTNYFLAQWLD